MWPPRARVMFGAVSKSTSPDGSPLQPAGVDGVLGIGYSWLGCHPTCVPAPLDALLRCAPTQASGSVACLRLIVAGLAGRSGTRSGSQPRQRSLSSRGTSLRSASRSLLPPSPSARQRLPQRRRECQPGKSTPHLVLLMSLWKRNNCIPRCKPRVVGAGAGMSGGWTRPSTRARCTTSRCCTSRTTPSTRRWLAASASR